jgi:hypothetical protein
MEATPERVPVPGRMIDHTGLKVSDPVASRRFYETVLAPVLRPQSRVLHRGNTRPR